MNNGKNRQGLAAAAALAFGGLVLAVFFHVFSNAVNNLAWGNLANASADQAAAFVGLWQADLLLISVATFLMGYILGKFSYKLRQSVHNPRGH